MLSNLPADDRGDFFRFPERSQKVSKEHARKVAGPQTDQNLTTFPSALMRWQCFSCAVRMANRNRWTLVQLLLLGSDDLSFNRAHTSGVVLSERRRLTFPKLASENLLVRTFLPPPTYYKTPSKNRSENLLQSPSENLLARTLLSDVCCRYDPSGVQPIHLGQGVSHTKAIDFCCSLMAYRPSWEQMFALSNSFSLPLIHPNYHLRQNLVTFPRSGKSYIFPQVIEVPLFSKTLCREKRMAFRGKGKLISREIITQRQDYPSEG